MHSDDRTEASNAQPRHLLKAIQRLPRWDSTDDSIDKGASREESLIVQQQNLFGRNNRQREHYCEEESDLQTLNDWVCRDDDLNYTDACGFAQSQAAEELYDRVCDPPHLESVSVRIVERSRQMTKGSPDKSKTRFMKDSFVENLRAVDMVESLRWQVDPEGEVNKASFAIPARVIRWQLLDQPVEYSFDNKGGRPMFRVKKRIFDQQESIGGLEAETQVRPACKGLSPHIEVLDKRARELPVQIVRHEVRVERGGPNVQPLLDELLVCKQRETALAKLSRLEDELSRSVRRLCALTLAKIDLVRSEETVARKHYLALSQQIEKSQKHLKYCYVGRYQQAQRQAETVLRLVAIPLSYSRVLLERQSELESLIQNILSATSLEKLIKAESAQRFLSANLELLEMIEQKEGLDRPLHRVQSLENLKFELENDVRQIRELLLVLPDSKTLEAEFVGKREQQLTHISEKIRNGSYRQKERTNILDYFHRQGIVV